MRLPFLDRADEARRLRRFLAGPAGGLAVIFGRRRCGKSTLIQHVCAEGDLYFLADESAAPLQIQGLAAEAGRTIPAFGGAAYPSWDALLATLEARVDRRLNVVLDEFPYLVGVSPELPSVIQRHIDKPGSKRLSFVLCGSSQRMMQGLVLGRTAPLYGRAQEILKVEPLRPGWIPAALSAEGAAGIEAYAVWGGVPRYWELARGYHTLREAVRQLVLDPHGVLHDEPSGLLLDEARSAGQTHALLSLIGGGSSRLSEIAGRMGKPAGSLTRPLANLIELGYVRKGVPFGESELSSKRTIYRLGDPFLAFYYRFMQPYRSLLELGSIQPVEARLKQEFPSHVAAIWEDLARQSVPLQSLGGEHWGAARRWWGAARRPGPELDVVAESLDRRSVLVGEVKWSDKGAAAGRWGEDLRARAAGAPFVKGRKVVLALWLKRRCHVARDVAVVTPEDVLDALR